MEETAFSKKKDKVERVKLAAFTKAGRGRNQCKRRRAKRVVHRNRNALGLTEKQKRELGRQRRAGRNVRRRNRERRDEEIQDKICGWHSNPSGGADTDATDTPVTPPLLDPPSLQQGKDGGGSGGGPKPKPKPETGGAVDALDPDKRCVCVCVCGAPFTYIFLLRCGQP